MKNKILIIMIVLLSGSCGHKNTEEQKSEDAEVSNTVVKLMNKE